ncbi:hypothetical protein D3C84_1076710 [compost metagenome]
MLRDEQLQYRIAEKFKTLIIFDRLAAMLIHIRRMCKSLLQQPRLLEPNEQSLLQVI